MGENEPPKSAYVGEGEAGLEGVCARNWPLVEWVNDEGLIESCQRKIRFSPSDKAKKLNRRRLINEAYFRIYAPIETSSA